MLKKDSKPEKGPNSVACAQMLQGIASVYSRWAKNFPMFLNLFVSNLCTVLNCTPKPSVKLSFQVNEYLPYIINMTLTYM